jgi:hypothetical protein
MRSQIIGFVLAATLALAAPAAAQTAASYGPGAYQAGPKNGDASTFTQADPETGKVVIFQHNTRQAAAVNCTGDGPRATLAAVHHVTDEVRAVHVTYEGATLSDHEIVMDVLVTGSRSGPLGHRAALGPKINESGTINLPLRARPQRGETMTVQFGLQTGQGCLPHPFMLGLPGSRLVNGGQATFTAVKVR